VTCGDKKESYVLHDTLVQDEPIFNYKPADTSGIPVGFFFAPATNAVFSTAHCVEPELVDSLRKR